MIVTLTLNKKVNLFQTIFIKKEAIKHEVPLNFHKMVICQYWIYFTLIVFL